MSATTDGVREDFDRIARLTERHGDAGDVYRDYLARCLPPRLENALEIGCGGGEFTRLLASRAGSVVALDLSPEMIRVAKARTAGRGNVEYRLCDVMQAALPAESFDCVVSIATLHHLPLAQALLKMKGALRPGGVLVLHDLIADDSLLDRGLSALAFPLSAARRLWKTGRLRTPREIRRAWDEHGAGEVYLTPAGVGEMCREHLPGATFKRHLLWRYTVVWRKSARA